MQTVQQKVLQALRKRKRHVFASKDFLKLGSRAAVDQALSRLAEAGTIQRLGRGIYALSWVSPSLGVQLAPDMHEVAEALARKTRSRLIPTGAVAANQLGLSTQVPAQLAYLTDGRSRRVRVGNTVISVKHAAPKDLPCGRPRSAMVFQALRHLGKRAVDDEIVHRLRRRLSADERRRLLEDARYATSWIAEVVRRIAADDDKTAKAGHRG